ncbi:MAG TPA: cytochrome P450 [Acidimicrobiales bacterium]|nr:cytochrome P450 [Acidimicrobiales bacterium]
MTSSVDAVRYDPFDPEDWLDPYPVYQRLRDEDPVHRVVGGAGRRQAGSGAGRRGGEGGAQGPDFWVLSRFADVFTAATDTETFSSAQGLTFEGDEIAALGLLPTLVMMDRPGHTGYRRLVNRAFTPRRVAGLEPAVRAFVRGRMQRIAEAGTADFVDEVAGALPGVVVATFLGVPPGDLGVFTRWSSAIVQANAAGSVMSAAEAVGDLYRYFGELSEWRRSHPGDDVVSSLVASELDGRPVTVEEVLGFCFVMVAGGNDTATGLLGHSAALLTSFPDERRRLRDDPALVPGAVEELLRFTSPVQGLSRTATRPVDIDGTAIPAGAKVHLLYGAANRDPREFGPRAERLDVGRRIERMLAFGSGPHHCLGAAAARLQGRVVLEELLATMPDFVADPAGGTLAPGPFTRRYDSLPISAAG